MIAILLASLFVLLGGLAATAAWGWRQRAALRSVHRSVERGRTDGERELDAQRAAHAALGAENRQLRTQLGETQRELAQLSYSISHDLRAPLRSVDGFSQALAEDYGHCLNSTAHDYLRRVRANAQHMSALIDQLLGLARIVRVTCQPEPVDLSALARETAGELAAADPARRVEWDIQPGVVAQGDRALLGTAMRHLLGNAWKFTSRRPVAHIAFRVLPPAAPGTAPAGTVYEVRDDGVGFDMQYAGKLFGAFQRMHQSDEFSGHGIGLAAVQRIVRQHGGSVWVDAAPEQGAVFSFTLDAAPADNAAGPPRTGLPVRAVESGAPVHSRPRPTAV